MLRTQNDSHCGTTGFHSYKYDTVIKVFQNDTADIVACADPLKTEDALQIPIKPSVDNDTSKDFHRFSFHTFSHFVMSIG